MAIYRQVASYWMLGACWLCCVSAQGQRMDLARGVVEVNGFLGTTAETSHVLDSPRLGGGFEAAFGLSRHWAVSGSYAIGRTEVGVFCFQAPCPALHRNSHQVMGGMRYSLANRTRFTPYFTGTLGGVKITEPSRESFKFAAGMGAGVDIAVGSRAGILLDLRGIKPVNYPGWLVRGSAGIYFRF